jgi:hypothetical protein
MLQSPSRMCHRRFVDSILFVDETIIFINKDNRINTMTSENNELKGGAIETAATAIEAQYTKNIKAATVFAIFGNDIERFESFGLDEKDGVSAEALSTATNVEFASSGITKKLQSLLQRKVAACNFLYSEYNRKLDEVNFKFK